MLTKNSILVLVLGLALGVAAGCDDDDDDRPDAGRRDAAVPDGALPDGALPDGTLPDAMRPDAGPPTMTIAELATVTPDLSLLVTAVTRAELVDALGGEGSLTVFAPTNAAFAAAGITQAMIEAMPAEDLQRLLQYHVVAEALTAEQLQERDARFVPTLAENRWELPMVVVLRQNGELRINDAGVVRADLQATNGVVHQVDRVLVPPTILQMVQYAGLDQLAATVEAASPLASGQTLADVLSGAGPFTIFAPVDEAFEAAQALLEGLNADEVRGVLLYHVFSTEAYERPQRVEDFPTIENARVQTLLGPPAAVDATATPPTVRDATIVEQDVHVANGTLHLIDGVLLPPGIAPAP